MPADERARRIVAMLEAGLLGEKLGRPRRDPATMALLFDAVQDGIDHRRAPREPVVLQWEFTDAEPWHVRVANGSARAAPGRVEYADVTYAARYEDFVDVFAGRLDRRRALATRRLRPRGSPSALWRTRHVFG